MSTGEINDAMETTNISLAWLADAPLFIDATQVGAFYDAVVRPERVLGPTVLKMTEGKVNKITGKVSLGAKVSMDALIKKLFPFLSAEGSISAEVGGEHQSSEGKEETIQLFPIDTPQRQLVQLALHYLANQEHRLALISGHDIQREDWRSPDYIQDLPHALVFIDLPGREEAEHKSIPKTKLIPMAAEFSSGEVALIFETLRSDDGRQTPPKWVDFESEKSPEEVAEEHKEYWQWFDKYFNPSAANMAVEEAAKGKGRVRWIDYQIPVTQDGQTLHLHISPQEKYDNGVFAFNLVKRGYEHGLRIVGTLKSAPDLNVLAIFEK